MGFAQRSLDAKADSGLWERISETPSTGYQEAIGNVVRRDRSSSSSASAPRIFFLNRIVGPTRSFQLRRSIGVSIREEEGGTTVAHISLPVQGFGMSLEEALADFQEMFEVQYAELVECDASDLAPGVEHVRAEFVDYVSAHGASSDPSR